jgi:hypothetical protein
MNTGLKLGAVVVCAVLLGACSVEESTPAKYQSMGAVSVSGPIDHPGGATEVWSVTRAWSETDAQDGMAWSADSALTWEDKYSAWIEAMGLATRVDGGKTFEMLTPHGGRVFPAPFLDCAEVAYFLRVSFASWYHLPFFVQGWDVARKRTVYAGHMGFVDKAGTPHPDHALYRDKYADHQDSWSAADDWPHDTYLRKRRIGDDDLNPFIALNDAEEETAGAGAYMDEMFLNKRVGHFVLKLFGNFGSIHLADGSNLFHVEADAIRAGDTLLKRNTKWGSGHTVPVLGTERLTQERVSVEVASGNVPRRQPRWEDTNTSRHRFTTNTYGGHGENSKGIPYAKLGGGLRRWRTAILKGDRWFNGIDPDSADVRILESDLERLAGRVDRFGAILKQGSPEERRDVALELIDSYRDHLRNYPASCSARISREDAFDKLYAVMADKFDTDGDAVDAKYRKLEDYVFGELVYEESKTCCWNKTTSAMADLILERAAAEQEDQCIAPTVFRFREDGYTLWSDYAESLGLGEQWVSWSEDEICPQANVSVDMETVSDVVAYCAL